MGISCQRNGHRAATNHLSGSGLVQPIKELSSAAGRCARRGCALIRQLANTVFVYYKKLIRWWDSERELSLRRHRIQKVQNTIDWCINSATNRRSYVLEHRFAKVSDITQCNGHYAVQGHSRSPILVQIENSYIRLPINQETHHGWDIANVNFTTTSYTHYTK